jgi:abortive infection bacteriophage resistance protein
LTAVKLFQSYDEQVARLARRGMEVGDHAEAVAQLRRVNYYRLSGYWYPFRKMVDGSRSDDFFAGTTLADVMKLYHFDASLRSMTFAALAPVELAVRASLGHALGSLHESIHLEQGMLNARAQGSNYVAWRKRYDRELNKSHEDFVEHHHRKYDGRLPVWAAVEILDWGSLTTLFGFAPRSAQDSVASGFGLSAPQLESWLKSLNIVRNVCAHHGRLFNRVFALAPKLPAVGVSPALDAAGPFTRTFGLLTLIQFLLESQGLRRAGLPAALRSFPAVRFVPLRHTGAPDTWQQLPLWS